MSFEEKRKFKRVNYSYEVLISLPNDEFEEEYTILSANSVNLSAGGILFKHPDMIEQNTEISMAFFPPHTQTIIGVVGKVIRVEKEEDHYLIVVEFDRFTEGSQQQLNSLLNSS